MEQLSIVSFLQHGHDYHLYVYEDIKGVPEGAILRDANEIVSWSQISKYRHAGFSDLFRYKLLLEKGGYWADADVVCLRPFDFESDYVFGRNKRRDSSRSIASAVIKAPAGCELLQFCYDAGFDKDPDGLAWPDLGPPLLTEGVKRFRLTGYALPHWAFSPIDWWNWEEIVSGRLSMRIKTRLKLTRGIYAVHLWNEIWRREKLDKNGIYHPQCLYEKLKRMYL